MNKMKRNIITSKYDIKTYRTNFNMKKLNNLNDVETDKKTYNMPFKDLVRSIYTFNLRYKMISFVL